MDHQKINSIVQIATSLAILVGLGLVVYELNQTKTLVMTQLTSDGFITGIQQEIAVIGENPSQAIAKACMNPSELTPDELILLDRLYQARIAQIQRAKALQEMAEFGLTWETLAEDSLPYIFNNEYGKLWWDNIASAYLEEEIASLGNQIRHSESVADCRDLVTATMKTLSDT